VPLVSSWFSSSAMFHDSGRMLCRYVLFERVKSAFADVVLRNSLSLETDSSRRFQLATTYVYSSHFAGKSNVPQL